MKMKVFLAIFICVVGAVSICMAKPPKPDNPIGDSADVLRDVKVLYENFRRNCKATVAQTHAVSDAIDTRLANIHKVKSVYLVPHNDVLKEYYKLVNERYVANCRVWAGCIGKICKDRNVPYHILTLGNEYSTNDPHTVIAIFNKTKEKYEIVDINNDLEKERTEPSHMLYDDYMGTQRIHLEPITFGYEDYWRNEDEAGAYDPRDVNSLNLGTVELKHSVCFVKSDAPAGVSVGLPFYSIDRK